MRSKLWVVAGIVLVSAATLVSATQTWIVLGLAQGAAAFGWLELTGQQLNASLSPVALAGLAAALALTIAAPVLRRILGVLIVLLGAGIAAIAIAALNDPRAAASGRLAEATGIAGPGQADLVVSTATSAAMPLTIVLGVALAVCGAVVLLLGGRWRSAGRRYASRDSQNPQASQTPSGSQTADDGEAPDRFDDWDSLSSGEDPTAPER